MQIKADEIIQALEQKIKSFETELKVENVGYVVQIGDGVARVFGLEKAMVSELIQFPNDVMGMVLNLEEDSVGCIILGDEKLIKEGDIAKATGKVVQIPVGETVIGRVINPIGVPLDGKGSIVAKHFKPVEISEVPSVVERQPVKEPLQTGWTAIDSMIPIGRGQRELILGDRQTGKTTIAIDTILNQKGQNVYCIYVAIGQKNSTIARVVDTLTKYGAMEYTTVVSTSAADTGSLQFLAPAAGCAIGEYFRDNGKHALVIYDDLTKHAWAYRQLSLILRRPPGREAYPGDIFNLHSRLLERAAKLSNEKGGGSLTSLPIIETQLGDVSAYIPTNVISITDGQIYLETDLFNSGIRPAINIGISVSRVGGNAQTKGMKKVAGKLRLELAQYRELAAFAQFASDLDKATQAQLNRGERLMEILKQGIHDPRDLAIQLISIYLGTSGSVDEIAVSKVSSFTYEFVKFVNQKYPSIRETINSTKELDPKNEESLKLAISEFKTMQPGTK
ncbi:MAG: F0F1 ATP synthase subunit alpha [Planctomycetes bacterium]|nr:F0F1 ATP synthase subunit alpha [Planctomycetota bacterium]